MPYSDQWGVTITKAGTGVYAVSRFGVSGTVTIDQVFPNRQQEDINVAAALARACELMALEREGVGDGDLARLWGLRARYAWARWKLLAYQRMVATSSGALRAAYQAKLDAWAERRTELESGPELDE